MSDVSTTVVEKWLSVVGVRAAMCHRGQFCFGGRCGVPDCYQSSVRSYSSTVALFMCCRRVDTSLLCVGDDVGDV